MDKRSVLAIAPTQPAIAAIFTWELNMIEKPKTPQKLAKSRKSTICQTSRLKSGMVPGRMPKTVAEIQPTAVAMQMISKT